MFVRTLAFAVLLSGCTGSVNRVKGLISEAPDWYEQRRVEIRGEGYPDVEEIPRLADHALPGRQLNREEAVLGTAEIAFLTHPRAEPAPATAVADAWALHAELTAKFEPVSTPPDVLTDAEIDALRSVFDKYTAGG